MTQEQLLTVDDVAERASVHPKTVLRAIRSGRLRAARLGARGAYRVRPDDFEDWVDSSTVGREQPELPGMETGRRRRPRRTGTLVVHEGMGKSA